MNTDSSNLNLTTSTPPDPAMTKQRKPQSSPHAETRQHHASETAEDYVEAVFDQIGETGECRVGDLAKRFSVSHVTVSRIVGRLVNENLLATEPYRPITLTSQGKKLATRVKRRHEVVFDFLIALGVDHTTATIDSEGIEHHVSPKTLAAMKRFINSADSR